MGRSQTGKATDFESVYVKVRILPPLPLLMEAIMAKQVDKTAYKNKIAEAEAEAQLQDLQHLEEKKKRLGRSELFKRTGEENESESTT